MPAMEVKCTRCGSTWRVPEEKAGKRGRCPQCWGVIKVPEKHVESVINIQYQAPAASHFGRTTILIGAAVALVAGGILTLVLRSGTEVTSIRPDQELAPEVVVQVRRLTMDLNKFEQVDDDCDALDDLVREERCLKAREVLRKDKAYESVSPAEYALRAAVKEEETAYRSKLEMEKQAAPPDWKLDTPLQEEERGALTQKSAELEKHSAQMKEEMAQLGVKAPERTDSLGRVLVDTGETRKLLAARETQLRANIAEIRKGPAKAP